MGVVLLRTLPYGANFVSLAETPEMTQSMAEKILFRYSASAPSVSDRLEEEACRRFDVAGALAVPSGTQALRLALLATRPRLGARVYIPAMTFVAVAGAVLSLGMIPVCVDVDENLALDPTLLPDDAERVVVAHMDGMVGPVPEITGYVIEDTAQAMGGRHRDGRAAGSVGFAGVFSFHHAKVLTSGEGGLVVTRQRSARDLMRSYSDHGSAREQGKYPAWESGAFFGENLTANEVVAGVQLQQFRTLDHILGRLERHHSRTVSEMLEAGISTIVERTPGDPKVSLHIDLPTTEQRAEALRRLESAGLPVWTLDKYLLPRHPVLRSRASIYGDGFPWSLDPDAEHLSRDAFATTANRLARRIVLPMAPELTDEAQDDLTASYVDAVVDVVR